MNDRMTELVPPEARSLSDCITEAIREYLGRSNEYESSPALEGLVDPVLRIEGVISDGQAHPETLPRRIELATISLSALRRQSRDVSSVQSIHAPAPTSVAEESIESQTEPTVSPVARLRRHSGRKRRTLSPASESESESSKRRRATGGLRLATSGPGTDEEALSAPAIRRLEPDARPFPQRQKHKLVEAHVLQPSSLDKLITGIWEQLHGSINLDPSLMVEQLYENRALEGIPTSMDPNSSSGPVAPAGFNGALSGSFSGAFSKMNVLCRKITQASRCCRSLEVIVQARWVEYFDARVQQLASLGGGGSLTKNRMHALKEACADFGWTEKELRNKMAVWRGYQEIKEAGGWVSLVFAGMGLYRFCKYRVGFSKEAMQRLQSLRRRFEVAADTLHPHWRQLLSIIGEPSERIYDGHPHDWVVSDGDEPIPLRRTYLQWDPNFSFEHLEDSIVDEDAWGPLWDPRRPTPASTDVANSRVFICDVCNERQSDDPKENCCHCFPTLYGCIRKACPVQVFRTANGRNNGLQALLPFPRGTALGEFTGLITRGLSNTDVMVGQPSPTSPTYQIHQARHGNYTRFVNHSCLPNSQFERFSWRGVQRIVLVSKGIEAGQEVTVDYCDGYWRDLDKVCLCGERGCRYKDRRVR